MTFSDKRAGLGSPLLIAVRIPLQTARIEAGVSRFGVMTNA
jgi:hypothetical protein